jgi:hypothetical protein
MPLPDWLVFVAKDSDSLARSVPGDQIEEDPICLVLVALIYQS